MMGIFFLWSTIAWLIVTILILAERRTFRSRREGQSVEVYTIDGIARLTARSRFVRSLIDVLILALGIVLSLSVFYEVWQPEPPLYALYDFVNGRRFGQMLLGIVFGAILAGWMIGLYHQSQRNRTRRSAKTKTSTALPNDANLMSTYQKIQGITLLILLVLGTTSITIEELVRSVKIGSDGVSLQLASNQADAKNTAAGATQSKNVLQPPPPPQSPSTVISAAKLEAQWGMTALLTLPTLASRDWRYLTKDFQNRFQGKLPPAELSSLFSDSYNEYITPIARCLNSLVTVTGDDIYLRKMIGDIKPFVRELFVQSFSLRGNKDDTEFNKIVSETKLKIAEQLYEIDDLTSNQARRLEKGVAMLDTVAEDIRRGEKRRLNCTENPVFKNKLEIDKYVADIAPSDFAERPYLAIVYAAILQLENQELAAVDALNEWSRVNAYWYDEKPKSEFEDIKKYWFDLRIQNSVFTVFETLFRRSPNQPQIIREKQMLVIDNYIDLLQERADLEPAYSAVFLNPRLDLIKTNFSKDIPPSGVCKFDQADFDLIGRVYTLLNAKLIYARRAIDHPEFAERFLPKAKGYVEEVVDADISCLLPFSGGQKGLEIIRAESFLVYARYMMAQALARKDIGSTYRAVTVADLTSAQNALDVAIAAIDKIAVTEADEDVDVVRLSNILDTKYTTQLLNELRAFRKVTNDNITKLQ